MSGKFQAIFSVSYLRCLLFLSLLIITFGSLSPHFLSFSNFDNILSASAVTGLLAIGVTFVMGSGGIDLSVASVMALSGTLCAVISQSSGNPAWQIFFLCAFIGGVCGLITGGLVNLTKAPSFIVTLGMLSVARALAFIVSDGMPVYGLPDQITEIGQGRLLGISIPVLVFLGAAIAAFVVLHCSQFGTHLLYYGDNPSAAGAMGLRIERLQLKVFGLAGIFSGISGFVFMARTNAGDPTAGQNYELVAITAAILGGTKLSGGQANIFGTVLGVICLGALQNGLNLLAVGTYFQVLFVGLVLICAALLERFSKEARG